MYIIEIGRSMENILSMSSANFWHAGHHINNPIVALL